MRYITEAFLRFSNPIGLVYTRLEKLYNKLEGFRKVAAPVINAFNRVAGEVKDDAIAFARYIGLMDTVLEKTAKLTAAKLERAGALREQTAAEIQLVESSGATAQEVSRLKIAPADAYLKKATEDDVAQQALHEKDLRRINAQLEANKKLADADKKPLSSKDTKILE